MLFSLNTLKHDSYSADHVVCDSPDGPLTWGYLVQEVNAIRRQVNACEHRVWALYETDSFRFIVALLALLSENRRVLLPGDNHEGVIESLRAEGALLWGDIAGAVTAERAAATSSCQYSEPWALRGDLAVFTSGSTGTPKLIVKRLDQLDAELKALQMVWGETLGNATVMSTVSHQHFYGLLFSVLWPLCAGRVFWRRPFVDPLHVASATAHYERVVWVFSPAHLHRLPADMPWELIRAKVCAVFSSGGPLRFEAASQVQAGLNRLPIEVLGSSETGGIAWRTQKTEKEPWQSFPDVEIRIADNAALEVRSPYLSDQHWFRCADSAQRVDDGRFMLGQRLDRIVKLEGKRVALPEVEQCLRDIAVVEDAAVVVLEGKRSRLGAVLQLTASDWERYRALGHQGFIRELREQVVGKMPAVAVPRKWRLVSMLPRNAQGKLLNEQLRRLFENRRYPPIRHQTRLENTCTLVLSVDINSPYFSGHFPDQPVLPGIAQIVWAQYFASTVLGLNENYNNMRGIKFKSLVFPDTELTLYLEYHQQKNELAFKYSSKAGVHSEGSLAGEKKA